MATHLTVRRGIHRLIFIYSIDRAIIHTRHAKAPKKLTMMFYSATPCRHPATSLDKIVCNALRENRRLDFLITGQVLWLTPRSLLVSCLLKCPHLPSGDFKRKRQPCPEASDVLSEENSLDATELKSSILYPLLSTDEKRCGERRVPFT